GGLVTTLAGSPGVRGFSNGMGASALFELPEGVSVDTSGNLYVADSLSNCIRKVTSGGMVSTWAGGGAGYVVSGIPKLGSANGSLTASSFYLPEGVAVDSSGDIYVAD